MCSIVTNSGSGNPKCSGANIHLLYKDNNNASVNLYYEIHLEVRGGQIMDLGRTMTL